MTGSSPLPNPPSPFWQARGAKTTGSTSAPKKWCAKTPRMRTRAFQLMQLVAGWKSIWVMAAR